MQISQKCFKDVFLFNFIERYDTLGECDFCHIRNTYVVDMDELFVKNKLIITEIFDLYCYEHEYKHMPNRETLDYINGFVAKRKNMKIFYDNLFNLLQKNWNLFDLNNISESTAFDILLYWAKNAIPYRKFEKEDLIDPYWYDMRFKNPGYFIKEDWNFLNFNMKHSYRYHPQNIPDINFDINDLFSNELFSKIYLTFNKGKILYRGRIKGKNIIKYKRNEMLIPPISVKSIGRANPIGINYLYTTDNIETAMAEVRAWKNCIVSIATLEFKTSMNLVDLSVADTPNSIFETRNYSEQDLLTRVQYCEIEALLYETLSRPIDPSDADIEYIFTQYICEEIRTLGYDGIVFKSSLGDGMNYVLFSDENIIVKEIQDYTVNDIKYKFDEIIKLKN
jgi:hypothetical protein